MQSDLFLDIAFLVVATRVGRGDAGERLMYNAPMSFYCPWQDGQFETCRKTGGTKCTPGKPGCVLFGKVAFAEDAPERRKPAPRKGRSSPTAIEPTRQDSRAQLLDELEAFPARLRGAVRERRQWDSPVAEGWTAVQIVHHLADVHAAGMARVRRALTETNPQVEPYDHQAWAELVDARDASLLDASLSILIGVHARWVALLRGLSSAEWERTYRHPELGRAVSIHEDLAWHVEHGREHLRKLA